MSAYCYFNPSDLTCTLSAGTFLLVFIIGVVAMVIELVWRRRP
jgi:hypothetical protein